MSYSGSGAYVFKNKEQVVDRCDVFLDKDFLESTPGEYPGFTHPTTPTSKTYHGLLGNGPIFIGLYKQCAYVIDGLEVIDLTDYVPCKEDPYITSHRYPGDLVVHNLNMDHYLKTEEPLDFQYKDHKITIYYLYEDNYYAYARLVEPDGTEWTGFSGYGVGLGHEDNEEFSTTERCRVLNYLFYPNPEDPNPRDLKITKEEICAIKNAQTYEEWKKAHQDMKDLRGGMNPKGFYEHLEDQFWYNQKEIVFWDNKETEFEIKRIRKLISEDPSNKDLLMSVDDMIYLKSKIDKTIEEWNEFWKTDPLALKWNTYNEEGRPLNYRLYMRVLEADLDAIRNAEALILAP